MANRQPEMAQIRGPRRGRGPAPRPLAYCPFDGKPMTFKFVRGFGRHIACNKKYVFGPFKTLGELLVEFSTRDGQVPTFSPDQAEKAERIMNAPVSAIRPAASHPLTQCPFTGKKVRITQEDPTDPTSRWRISGEHYFIGGFKTRRQAEFFFSTREGRVPTFSKLDVEVIDRTLPESAGEVEEGTGIDDARAASEKLVESGIGEATVEE